MFALVLDINKDVVLVWKTKFSSEAEALEFAKSNALPGIFEVVAIENLPKDYIEIPVKEKTCRKR